MSQDGLMSDRPQAAGPQPPVPDGSGPSIVRRFLYLFHDPKRAWTLPLRHPIWITALVVLSVFQIAQSWLLRDLVFEQMRSSMERSEQLPEEQRELILQRMEEASSSAGGFVRQSIGGVAGAAVLSYLLPALVYLLGLNFVLGARASFREVFAVTAFSHLILLVRDVIRVPLMLAKDSLYVFVSPAAFVDPENRTLVWMLDRFDLFGLYRLFVVVLGLALIAGIAPKRAAGPVVVLWLLILLLGVAFMQSPIGKMFG